MPQSGNFSFELDGQLRIIGFIVITLFLDLCLVYCDSFAALSSKLIMVG